MLLEAEFLAALQVLVYIGAVAILLMFGIMLTRNIQGDDPASTPSAWQLPGLVAGLGVFLVLAFRDQLSERDRRPVLVGDDRAAARRSHRDESATRRGRRGGQYMAKVVGDELMTRYVIAFEVAGLLLTAALVGAIAIAHREEIEPAPARPAERCRQREPAGPSAGGSAHRELAAQPSASARDPLTSEPLDAARQSTDRRGACHGSNCRV